MKALVALLVLITASVQSEEATVTVKIKAYTATGEVTKNPGTVPQGTRVLFTCDVEGLPEGQVNSYKWYRSSRGTGRSEIQNGEPYYRVVNDTLLVDATSWGGVQRWHICEVDTVTDFFTLRLTDSSTLFILTPTSLLPKNALITDVHQITGRNGKWWINCTSGRNGRNVRILSVVDRSFSVGNEMNTAIIAPVPGRYPHNGLYYCSAEPTSFNHFSLFLRNSSNLPTPMIHTRDNTTWTFTSRIGSQVKRYIIQLECSVRNITFIEKYVSDSVGASKGIGQVATSVSCFGGLGQLYRMKVWAVSAPNISRKPAVKCFTPDQQCMMEGEVDGSTLTTQVLTPTPTAAGDSRTASRDTTSTRSGTTSTRSGTTSTRSGTTSTRSDTTSTRSDRPSLGPEPTDSKFEGKQAGFGTFIGVGIGTGMLLLIVVLALVGVIVAVVMVKRRAANTKIGSVKIKENPSYYNPVVVELEVKGPGANYEDVDKDKANGSIRPDFDPYEDVDCKPQMKNTQKPAPKESSTPASATNVGELYAVVDKSKKKGAKKKQEENGCTVSNRDDLYTVPEKKKRNMTDEEKVASSSREKSEECNDVEGLKYEPKVDRKLQQTSEGDNKAPNVDMLYAVVDKSRKKKT